MKPFEIDISDLIPQRPPVVMIDRLIHADDKTATGQLLVTESNLFSKDGLFSEAGLTEFIAQTAAAYKGYQRLISGQDIKEGYIAAVKNLVVHRLPAVNTSIECRIIAENEIIGYTIVSGRVLCGEEILAEAEMRIKE